MSMRAAIAFVGVVGLAVSAGVVVLVTMSHAPSPQIAPAAGTDDIDGMRAELRKLRRELDDARRAEAAAHVRLTDAERALADQLRANTEAARRIEELERVLKELGRSPPESPRPDPRVPTGSLLEGKVQAVDNEMDVYVLSVGTSDGVEVGDEFTVYRGSDYVATVVVDKTFPNHSSCHMKKGMRKLEVKAGDTATRGL